ncbi:MAG: SOS response-associated peptidase [Dehalococcoidia bacterium]|nr:SOS response-associated peptidase [Dehalococcoidia bacterium]
MCGRFVYMAVDGLYLRFRIAGGSSTRPELHRAFGQEHPVTPRFNIAPTQQVITVTNGTGDRRAEAMRWGYVPGWAKEGQKLPLNINARDDRLVQSAMWRTPLRKSRCLVPADGYYEWRRDGRARHPVFFRRKDRATFSFAGLYDPDTRSCAVITTSANELVASVHDRMPAMLDEEAESLWLDPLTQSPEQLLPLVRPFPSDELEACPVSPLVNSVANDTPACIIPAG